MLQMRAKMEAEDAAAQGDMKECPFCAERIRAKAIICRFCNRELPREGDDAGSGLSSGSGLPGEGDKA
jgi:hypothetical protein